MTARLIPCPACARHVRAGEADCPFCSANLPETLPPVVGKPNQRLGRAALFAFGAAAAGVVAVTGCGDDTIGSLYGAPPTDSGMADVGPIPDAGTDAAEDASSDAGDAASDASADASDGGPAPMYGAPPADGG